MSAPPGLDRPSYLRFLPRFLFEADGAAWRYILKAWPVTLLPSLALAALLSVATPEAVKPEFGSGGGLGVAALVASLVLIGPFLETLIMAAVLEILVRVVRPGVAVILSAVLWGLAHSFGGLLTGIGAVPTWGLVVWWPFLILSIVYLTWRGHGRFKAILVATAIHGLQNAVGAAALVAGA